MKLAAPDSLSLEQFVHRLHGIGYKGAAVQLGQGILTAGFEMGSIGSVIGVRFSVDREFLFCGARDKSLIPFAVMQPGSESWYHGANSTGGDICGFQSDKDDTDCSWIGSMACFYVPKKAFNERLRIIGAHVALKRLDGVNCLAPDLVATAKFLELFEMMMNRQVQTEDQILDFLALQLCCATAEETQDGVRNWARLTEGVRQIHRAAASEPLSVKDWALGLNMHETTLRAATKERFNITPSELHRLVRLTQAYIYLEDGTKQVDQAMTRYRFRNRGEFARYFREHFSINPSELCSDDPLVLAPQQLELFAA